MNPLVIRRFEYDSLRIGEEGFSEKHFARLVSFNDQHGNHFFVAGNRRVIFQNYVGVIQVGALTIEILPKLDRQTADEATMQKLLVKMLHRVNELPLEKTDAASLLKTSGSLFELYLRVFIAEVQGIIYRGIPKRYSLLRGNEHFLRGRFLVPEQVRTNLIRKDRFFVEHQIFTIDHPFNRILKRALLLISGLPCNFSDAIEQCLSFFDNVSDRKITARDFARLKYNRNTECYRTAISIAELIITNFQPDVQFGRLNIMAMLFDMNRLFERYVAGEMLRHAKKTGKKIVIRTQPSKIFWRQTSGNSRKTIRPDILVDTDDGRFILDTKWKLLSDRQSGDGDLKQLYTYSLQFDAKHVFLVYPSSNGRFERTPGYFSESGAHSKRLISQWEIPLLSGKELNADLGKAILSGLSSGDAFPGENMP